MVFQPQDAEKKAVHLLQEDDIQIEKDASGQPCILGSGTHGKVYVLDIPCMFS